MIPIMRPLLPSAARLLPYLEKIDETRIYTNFGPLAASLEGRLAARFELSDDAVITVANATLGLSLALAAQDPPPGSLCILPGWTFVASAHAAVMAGLTPYFVDVDPETWALDPSLLLDTLASAPASVGAVVPVAPFGRPVDTAAWDAFHADTGLPVVLDAAAGFDSLVSGTVPAVVSLHATKILGAGEGGFVISRDRALIRRIRTRSNFGFQGTREARTGATNAKLSEYHAAVALAALDEWPQARGQWMAAAVAYRDELSQSSRVRFQDAFGSSWISSTCVLDIGPVADRLEATLHDAAITTRRWWGQGAHAHAATRIFPRAPLPATEQLARTTLAIPFSRDIEREQVRRISNIICSVTDA